MSRCERTLLGARDVMRGELETFARSAEAVGKSILLRSITEPT
jgi:hypothetical protein